MKINKDWEPKLVTCIRCDKDFNVNYTVGESDNCLPVFNEYNIERILRGHIDDYNWSDEKMLQWLNITSVLFICPHCKHKFGSTMNCYVCNKPVYHWLGHGTGYTCSDKCFKIYSEWCKMAKERRASGVIPREIIMRNLNDDGFLKTSRREYNG